MVSCVLGEAASTSTLDRCAGPGPGLGASAPFQGIRTTGWNRAVTTLWQTAKLGWWSVGLQAGDLVGAGTWTIRWPTCLRPNAVLTVFEAGRASFSRGA